MAQITLQVLEGLERGRTFQELATPVSIGREEENTVRLNDERISRFHAKLQEDGGRIILTDLDSTNGTRVNGRPISARVLRPGDQISVGRCLLTYGARDELDQLAETARKRRAATRAASPASSTGSDPEATRGRSAAGALAGGGPAADSDDAPPFLPPGERPPVPRDLDPLQRAQLCDLLAFAHEEIHGVLAEAIETDAGVLTAPALPDRLPDRPETTEQASLETSAGNAEADDSVSGSSSQSGVGVLPTREAISSAAPQSGGLPRAIPWEVWQRLMRLEMDLAESLRAAAEPG